MHSSLRHALLAQTSGNSFLRPALMSPTLGIFFIGDALTGRTSGIFLQGGDLFTWTMGIFFVWASLCPGNNGSLFCRGWVVHINNKYITKIYSFFNICFGLKFILRCWNEFFFLRMVFFSLKKKSLSHISWLDQSCRFISFLMFNYKPYFCF